MYTTIYLNRAYFPNLLETFYKCFTNFNHKVIIVRLLAMESSESFETVSDKWLSPPVVKERCTLLSRYQKFTPAFPARWQWFNNTRPRRKQFLFLCYKRMEPRTSEKVTKRFLSPADTVYYYRIVCWSLQVCGMFVFQPGIGFLRYHAWNRNDLEVYPLLFPVYLSRRPATGNKTRWRWCLLRHALPQHRIIILSFRT